MKKRDIIETHPRGIQQQTSVSRPELTDSEADRQRILLGESFHFSAKIKGGRMPLSLSIVRTRATLAPSPKLSKRQARRQLLTNRYKSSSKEREGQS